ncbi:putative secreted protein with PEP-CTERM sorting signal [Roseimicrobium gellanilyticum]|uniref:Putative secreted protein with PEP-CTERM sorting signal n=1 Tax=Roseimicrobium gellanilyticum TaxID=748857 RepID=A0A366HRF4_9BACT|nr:PEP-CTERM sorting domain-containing protein [Roseimicrobium gellanilyticum]RBP46255.1 putative secreted protein with PEP-CTERM sorting signal [Roseimicrobium gellanilyticum]
MTLHRFFAISFITVFQSASFAQPYVSNGSGHWIDDAASIWIPTGTSPLTGTNGSDSVTIGAGHTITYSGKGTGVGNTNASGGATTDFGVDNGNTITVDGGILAHTVGGAWVRIGNHGQGTLDIKSGFVYLPAGEIQVGAKNNAQGTIRIGDGTGAAGSAVLNLRDQLSGAASGRATSLNLGTQDGTWSPGSAGFITIESDGILEGANSLTVYNATTNQWTITQSITRIGRYASPTESVFLIKAGGQFNARGNVEVAASNANNGVTTKGLLHLDGVGARMTQYYGELNIAYNGEGRMIVENSAEYIHVTNAVDPVSGLTPPRNNTFIGRGANAIGTLTIRTDGKFIRDTGGNVGDLYIGNDGRGTVTIESGGEFINRSTNWDWIGNNAGSNGAVYVNQGGKYYTTANSSMQVGVNAANATKGAATGLIQVDGGELVMAGGTLYLGQNGNGTFRLISGYAEVGAFNLARGAGTATVDIQGGEMLIKGNLFAGGDTGADFGTNTSAGTATITQSGGKVTATNAMSIGLNAGHTATYTLTGGELYHLNSDMTIGEKGTGSMYIGSTARVYDQSTDPQAFFFVGRQNDSNGTVIVDGYLEKTSAAAGIRVGHGNDSAGQENNTTGRGLIGGTGTIKAEGGVWVGNYGTITGGTMSTVGQLTIEGNVNLISTSGAASQSTLFVNFDSSTALKADRLTITGDLNIDGAVINGTWAQGSETGLGSRYWVVVSENGFGLNDFLNMVYESNNDLASQYLLMGANGFVTIDGMEFAMFYGADFDTGTLFGGNDLMLSAMGAAVPEPSMAMLSLVGLASAMLRRRRKAVRK